MTYLQALERIAADPESTTSDLRREVADRAREVVRKETEAGRPHGIWAAQAQGYLEWLGCHYPSDL